MEALPYWEEYQQQMGQEGRGELIPAIILNKNSIWCVRCQQCAQEEQREFCPKLPAPKVWESDRLKHVGL